MALDSPVSRIKQVRDAEVELMHKLGLMTIADLLRYLPRRFDDTRALVKLSDLQPGVVQTARVRIGNVNRRTTSRKRILIVQAQLEDDTGSASAVWFNQAYMQAKLQSARNAIVSGKVKRTL